MIEYYVSLTFFYNLPTITVVLCACIQVELLSLDKNFKNVAGQLVRDVFGLSHLLLLFGS